MELQIAKGARGRSRQPAGNDPGQLAADFPPPPGTDTTGPIYRDGLFSRIVGVNFPKKVIVAEQGLLQVGSTAIALDTGDSFSGMSTGATGLLRNTKPFTVLTPGVVVYGQPQQHGAKPCFMACTDGTTILRGHQDVGGDMEGIVWDPVYAAEGLCGLSFAGGIFFVVYQPSGAGKYDSSCAVSFDGQNFSEIGNIYGGLPHLSAHDQLIPGPVAFNGNDYATAGIFEGDPNYPYFNLLSDFNMAWASSSDGSSWSADATRSETADPGTSPGVVQVGSGQAVYLSIAGGNGIFVAAATARTTFQTSFPVPGTGGEEFEKYVFSTAAAAVSNNGNSWAVNKLPGAIEADYVDSTNDRAASNALSVAFVKTGANTGYFVITAAGFTQTAGVESFASWCWKGDGSSWDMVKQADDKSINAVSAIARDLSATKIVYV